MSRTSLERLAVVDPDRCRPSKCDQQCARACPVNRSGQDCVKAARGAHLAEIVSERCVGCNICVKKCPLGAIRIVNVPAALSAAAAVHQYGRNGFRLCRLPAPRAGRVLGLVGANGTGKSTALKLLSGRLQPSGGPLPFPQAGVVRTKPQHVELVVRGAGEGAVVGEVLRARDERGALERVVAALELGRLLERPVDCLSGGELQRFTLAVVAVQRADLYLIDEPGSYLDVRQRVRAAQVVRELGTVVVVEHDLCMLEFMSDEVSVLYGVPGAYGVASRPLGSREGLNVFISGFDARANVRFREQELSFAARPAGRPDDADVVFEYPDLQHSIDGGQFELAVSAGQLRAGEVVALLGQNGIGKTTLLRLLRERGGEAGVSLKPQRLAPRFRGSVRELLERRGVARDAQFRADVLAPLAVEELHDRAVRELCGGELQRVALALALGRRAELYLIDEPSSYLDAEMRLAAATAIRRRVARARAAALVVEHDFLMSAFLADRVVVFAGEPGGRAEASAPRSLPAGMNAFLRGVGVTFRRDPATGRPRVNKPGSGRDRGQKAVGEYWYLSD